MATLRSTPRSGRETNLSGERELPLDRSDPKLIINITDHKGESMSEDNNYLLFRWIKKQQEKAELHQQQMIVKNAKDDEEFIKLIKVLTTKWGKVKRKDQSVVLSLLEWKDSGKNFSVNQRGMITGLYLRYYE